MSDALTIWPCPECRRPDGDPYLTTTVRDRPGVVVVMMRCRSCRHEWQVQHQAEGEVASENAPSKFDRNQA